MCLLTNIIKANIILTASKNLVNWAPWGLPPNPSGTVQMTDPAPSGVRKFYRTEQP